MDIKKAQLILIVLGCFFLLFPPLAFCDAITSKVTLVEPRRDGGIIFTLENQTGLCAFLIHKDLPENVRNQYLGILLLSALSASHNVNLTYYVQSGWCGNIGVIGLEGDSYLSISK